MIVQSQHCACRIFTKFAQRVKKTQCFHWSIDANIFFAYPARMAKKKFDTTKHHPSAADLQTLADTLSAYADECKIAVKLMEEKSTPRLIVSNWDTLQRAIGYIDKFMRQAIPAAKFGSLDARIYELMGADTSQLDATARADAAALHEPPKQQPKGGTKRKPKP